MKQICKNCKFWKDTNDEGVLNLGRCTRAKMIWDVTEWYEDEDDEVTRVLSE